VDSIRVWLEPNYDHGRTGAWLLDWPGAFAWGETRDIALGRSIPAAHRFVDWLASHGETPPPVPLANREIVEEVSAYTLPDGYEVNATFATDERPVDASDVETTLRTLAYARLDLDSVVSRVLALESGGRGLPVEERSAEAQASGAINGRELDAILRHIAGAETWFVSRLDAAARYSGTREDTADYLRVSRQFLADGLRRLVATEAPPRTDSKGERWTLAKVLRRAIYHSVDHLEELDRRLAMAERRVDRVELRSDKNLDPDALRLLFASAGLTRRARDSDELMTRWLAGTGDVVSAWDGDELVGFARLISDGATNAYVSTMAVAPRWQDRGLGTRIMRSLMDGRESMKLVLESAVGAERFYERLGFVRAPNAFVRQRRAP
jgi:ribosomal protein S18 acetylase RimI-like enzyme